MRHRNKLSIWLLGLFLALQVSYGQAENVQDFGDYVVHFNALTTDHLPPIVSTQYGIKRSKQQAIVNVVILRKVPGTTGQPVAARIEATTTNLTGRETMLNLREIREPDAIYYIADFPVSHEEILKFEIELQPEDSSDPLNVRFQQQFFTN